MKLEFDPVATSANLEITSAEIATTQRDRT
jgi:hypothetical protein